MNGLNHLGILSKLKRGCTEKLVPILREDKIITEQLSNLATSKASWPRAAPWLLT